MHPVLVFWLWWLCWGFIEECPLKVGKCTLKYSRWRDKRPPTSSWVVLIKSCLYSNTSISANLRQFWKVKCESGWWFTFVIFALGKLRQENCHKFEASLARLCGKTLSFKSRQNLPNNPPSLPKIINSFKTNNDSLKKCYLTQNFFKKIYFILFHVYVFCLHIYAHTSCL